MNVVKQINNGQNNVQIVQNNNDYMPNQQQMPSFPNIDVDNVIHWNKMFQIIIKEKENNIFNENYWIEK